MGNESSGGLSSSQQSASLSSPESSFSSYPHDFSSSHRKTQKNKKKKKRQHSQHTIRILKQRHTNCQQQKRQRIDDTKLFNDFFIQYHKEYTLANPQSLSLINPNPKRLVFISIYGLFRTWKQCPSMSLYNAIFILPLKHEWIQFPALHQHEHEYNTLFQDYSFLTLLRWKSHQQLAIFMLDNERDIDLPPHQTQESMMIAPVWRRLSVCLQSLHDPIANSKYCQLIFDEKYWKNESKACKDNHDTPLFQDMLNLHMTEYCVNWKDVLRELCFVTMKFKTIKLIIHESNSTLHVVTNYQPQLVDVMTADTNSSANKENELELGDNWWIADDYHDDD